MSDDCSPAAFRVYCPIMARALVQTASWRDTRLCPRCGCTDSALQPRDETAVFDCPSCGQDLYARPALSYAEMEGFDEGMPRKILGGRMAEYFDDEPVPSLWRRVLSAVRRVWRRPAQSPVRPFRIEVQRSGSRAEARH